MTPREQNRQDMPEIAQWVDEMRELFGPVVVKWAKEGNHTVGRKPDG
jgi:hypothetical protein